MNGTPVVSVVTPVYNGEEYLAECVESVMAQTYPHWEYVIVNNRSTDRSRAIAERYAEQDPRIRVHSNEHFVDVVQSHNIAVRQISQDSVYCKMVHADDWLFPDCLRQMVEVAEAHPTVGIVGAYRLDGVDGVEVGCTGLPYPTPFISGRALGRRTLLGAPGVFGSANSVLYRSQCVRERNPMFNESDFHADTDACLSILRTWDFGFVHQVLTYTRRHPATQTSFAEAMNTYQASELRHLVRYGPTYLTPDEFDRCLKRILARYCRFLAKSVTGPRAAEVWRYHLAAMANVGYPLDWGKMMRALGPFFGYAVTHPVATLRLGLRLVGLDGGGAGRKSRRKEVLEPRSPE